MNIPVVVYNLFLLLLDSLLLGIQVHTKKYNLPPPPPSHGKSSLKPLFLYAAIFVGEGVFLSQATVLVRVEVQA